MIDCSSDRWAGISIDDASTLHSVACILHFSAVIIAISPVEGRERNALGHQTDGHRRSGNASEQCMVAADSPIQCSLFKMDQHGGALVFRFNLCCRHRAASVQFHLPEGWLDMRDLGAVLEPRGPPM